MHYKSYLQKNQHNILFFVYIVSKKQNIQMLKVQNIIFIVVYIVVWLVISVIVYLIRLKDLVISLKKRSNRPRVV